MMSEIGYICASLLLIVALIVAVVAQTKVSSTYNTYSKINAQSGMTGRQLAERIISAAGLKVEINMIKGHLTDNYDPRSKVLNLSAGNIDSSSVAALGVVAHECGHAIQDAKGYKPLKVRQAVVKTTNLVSKLLMPLLILGLVFDLMYIGGPIGMIFIWSAVGFYGLSVLASLVTLPVETNASRRALKMLEGFEVMDSLELSQTKKVLSAAALTYLASLLVSLAFFLRFLFIALSAMSDR